MKVYISKVEGLLLNSPAAILHKDQKLMVDQDTVDVLTAVAGGKLILEGTLPAEPEEKPNGEAPAYFASEDDSKQKSKTEKQKRSR